jgi:hypothetical protein
MSTKKVNKKKRKTKYYYEGSDIAEDIHWAKKERQDQRAEIEKEQSSKKKGFISRWMDKPILGSPARAASAGRKIRKKYISSADTAPYPIRETSKAALVPFSTTKDFLGRQGKKASGWRERRKIAHDLKLQKIEEKQKKLEEEIRTGLKKELPKNEKEKQKMLEEIDRLHSKRAKTREKKTLLKKDGTLNTSNKAGIKANHLGKWDWIRGRKPRAPDSVIDEKGRIIQKKLNEWKQRDPDSYRKYLKQQNRFENKVNRWKKAGDWRGKHISWQSKIGKRLTRDSQLKYAKGAVDTTKRTITRFGSATADIGEAISESAEHSIGPIQVFQLAWQRMSITLKWLIIIVFLVVILFVPWGIFYYSGWAVAAAFMFLISLIYWVFISFFNGIAYVLVSLINGITRVVMGVIIFVVEYILDFFTSNGTKFVPNPTWAARFKGDPWTYDAFKDAASRSTTNAYCVAVYSHYWYEGHILLEGSLIRYDQIANIPSLMFISPPEWQPWMYNIIIVKLFEHIPGLAAMVKAWDIHIGRGMSDAMGNFVATAEPWLVVLVGSLPFIAIIGIFLYVWYKNKDILKR